MTLSTARIFLGSMTGTSLDGMDLVAVAFVSQQPPQLLHQRFIPYPDDLRSQLLYLCSTPDASISDCCRLDSWLGEFYASSIGDFLTDSNLSASEITALGSHGQTIRHNIASDHPYTLQIGDPNIIAAQTGLTVVADFRRRDVALGGQGAPLAPAFHQQVFHSENTNRAILNIGGIANITHLPANSSLPVTGFDTGPGNTLIDHISQQHLGNRYDQNGESARTGNIIKSLLDEMLDYEPYFAQPHPKSTGTDYFSSHWLRNFELQPVSTPDLLATLTELTAVSISRGLQSLHKETEECYVCGGGVHNKYLMKRLAAHLNNCTLKSTEALGIHPDWIEAMAFAWLAKQTVDFQPGNLPSVTNADRFTVLGGIYHSHRQR